MNEWISGAISGELHLYMFTSESDGEKKWKSVNIWQSYGQEYGVLFFESQGSHRPRSLLQLNNTKQIQQYFLRLHLKLKILFNEI